MNTMKYSDSAGFICADCSNIDLGKCDLNQALEEFDQAPWELEFEKFDSLDKKSPTPCWPGLTFRIAKYHIGFMLESDTTKFRVEVCTPPERKLFGIFNFTKFFEFNANIMLVKYQLIHNKKQNGFALDAFSTRPFAWR